MAKGPTGKGPVDHGTDGIIPSDMSVTSVKSIRIEDEMRTSYLDYAMSVIVARALPDVRDGLKPYTAASSTPWVRWASPEAPPTASAPRSLVK